MNGIGYILFSVIEFINSVFCVISVVNFWFWNSKIFDVFLKILGGFLGKVKVNISIVELKIFLLELIIRMNYVI